MSSRDLSDYVVTDKQYAELLKKQAQVFTALIALAKAFAKAPKGSYLVFPDPSNPDRRIIFKSSEFNAMVTKFRKSILDNKKYRAAARKSKRTTSKITPESLSGIYGPVYAGDALKLMFVTSLDPAQARPRPEFGYRDPLAAAQNPAQGGGYLMDSLQLAQNGYLLRNTVSNLMYTFYRQNGLAHPENGAFLRNDDPIMMEAFGGQVPAAFYRTIINGKDIKMRMQRALDENLINAPMNTYDVVRGYQPQFDADYRRTETVTKEVVRDDGTTEMVTSLKYPDGQVYDGYFPQQSTNSLTAINYFNQEELQEDEGLRAAGDYMRTEEARQQMLAEHNIVSDTSKKWRILLEPAKKAKEARKREADKAKRAAAKADKAAQAGSQ